VLPKPQRVELIITDRYQQVAGEYEVRALHRANEGMTAADYRAGKPDGALAVARTIELPHDEVVVVVSSDLFRLDRALARRMLLHEAQHVRLIQHGDEAHAVHRRVPFALTDDFAWEFLWLAEIAVDEFRCERAMHERSLPDPDSGSLVSDYLPIKALFDQALRSLAWTSDLLAAYHASFEALQRLSVYLAYCAAKLAVDPHAVPEWSGVPPMARVFDVVRNVPSPDERIPGGQLLDVAAALARQLRGIYQEMGFDLYLMDDGGRYLDVLH